MNRDELIRDEDENGEEYRNIHSNNNIQKQKSSASD